MQLNANSPKFLIALLILAGMSVVYSITVSYSTSQMRSLAIVAPRMQLAQVFGSSCTTSDLTCGLVGYWPLDGNAADSSGSGDSGTLVGGPTWSAGKIGQAIQLNGTSQGINLGRPAALDLTSSFTVSEWVDLQSSNSGIACIFVVGACNTTSTREQIFMYVDSNGDFGARLAVHDSAGDKHIVAPSNSYPINVWHLITGTYDSASSILTLYIDGSQVGTVTAVGPLNSNVTSGDEYGIGYNPGTNTGFFTGMIDDVRVYDRALSASEVASLYEGASSSGTVTPTPTPTAVSVTPPTGPTTYYIDFSSGSDSNSGTSKSAPWKRAPGMNGFAGMYTHHAGDRFIFKGGVTWDQSIFDWKIADSGTAGTPDYYGVDASWYAGSSWSQPVLDGGGTVAAVNAASFSSAVYITGSYITFDGLKIQNIGVPYVNAGDYAVWFRDGHDITVENMTIAPNSRIGLYVSNGSGTTASNYAIFNNDISAVSWGVGIAPAAPGTVLSNVSVHNNHFHDFYTQMCNGVHGDGIITLRGNDSTEYAATISDLAFYDNLFDGGFYAPSQCAASPGYMNTFIFLGDLENTDMYVYNNRAQNLGASVVPQLLNIQSDLLANRVAYSPHIHVFNNSFQTNSNTGSFISTRGLASTAVLSVRNNAVSGSLSGYYIGDAATLAALSTDYNDLDYSYQSQKNGMIANLVGAGGAVDLAQFQALGYETHSITTDPLFVSANDDRLQSASPAIGAGTNLAASCAAQPGLCLDAAGAPRPSTGAWDIGAYQSASSAGTVSSLSAGSGSTVTSGGSSGGSVSSGINSVGAGSGGGTMGGGGGGFGGGASIITDTNSGGNSPATNSPTTPCTSSSSAIPASALSLTIGTRGPEVTNLQTFLVIMGYLNRIYITGYFGPLTKAALNSYVASHPASTCNLPPVTTYVSQIPNFTRSLKLGMSGADVKNLQIFLNQHNFTVSQYGPGSSGHETSYFGPATFRALIRFQNAYASQILAPFGLSQGTGFFGPSTIKEVNNILTTNP